MERKKKGLQNSLQQITSAELSGHTYKKTDKNPTDFKQAK